jgi:hypothetical protein
MALLHLTISALGSFMLYHSSAIRRTSPGQAGLTS